MRHLLPICAAALVLSAPAVAHSCGWAYPIGNDPSSPSPLSNNHPVGGGNLPHLGVHLGADYWSGGGCNDLGQTVYAAADGVVVEVVDGLGSYLDVVVIEHQDPAVGSVYTMYGHISRNAEITEGTPVQRRQPIGFIDDVLAHFSPCHLHFEILSQESFDDGPFCNGCSAAGFSVSPGYDQNAGTSMGQDPGGDAWIEVVDGVSANRWYYTDEFIDARLDATCGECGDDSCDTGETFESCASDCDPCGWIEPTGGQVDDADACFFLGGDPQWWNEARGGEGGGHWFTHTTDSAAIDNFGIWTFVYEDAGTYALDVHIPAGSADSQLARYLVTHPGGTDEVVVDQSAGGWITLGMWSFEAETPYTVRLDDNTGEPFSNLVRLAFDAVRATRLDPPESSTSGSGGSDSSSGTAETSIDPTDPNPTTPSGGDESGSAQTSDGGTVGTDPLDSGPNPPGGESNSASGCGVQTRSACWWMLLPLLVIRRRRFPSSHASDELRTSKIGRIA